MTVTIIEPTTIEHLDFNRELTCDCENCWAGHPRATHLVIPHMICNCHRDRLACQSCVDRWLALMKFPDKHSCNKCLMEQPGTLRDLVEFRPL